MNLVKVRYTLVMTLLWWPGVICAGTPPQENDTQQVDARFNVSTGPGGSAVVEFYRRGPFPPVRAGQPDEYVRGIAVQEAGRVVDRWEADHTTIPVFYPGLNKIWTVRGPNHILITGAVQYGGRFVKLYALTWSGGKLEAIQEWAGETFSIKPMGSPSRFVVVVTPEDYSQIPELYVWDGTKFRLANSEFPEYFSALGAREACTIYNSGEKLAPAALVQSCRRSLEAYALAGRPEAGRRACVQARARIQKGAGVTWSTPDGFQREGPSAISEIDGQLEKYR
jgi:hypothetical protein